MHAIGGIEDHIHLLVSVPPKIAVAEFVRNIKGSSAHYLNHAINKPITQFGWQPGYGIFSLGGKQLDEAAKYIINQKQHHQENDIMLPLEENYDQDSDPVVWKNGKALDQIKVIGPSVRLDS